MSALAPLYPGNKATNMDSDTLKYVPKVLRICIFSTGWIVKYGKVCTYQPLEHGLIPGLFSGTFNFLGVFFQRILVHFG